MQSYYKFKQNVPTFYRLIYTWGNISQKQAKAVVAVNIWAPKITL